ncbi:MAG: response regulator [Oscillospiraceae bacterium]|nr:response regulator [Oscillospiraceae bacterium]
MEKMQKKIIVVDDSIVYLTALRNLLKSFYEVYPADSAEVMFSTMEKFIPDLVLLDVEMPKMNGFEAITYMKESPRYKDIPVVFLTSRNDEDSASKGLELGAADYITKPFFGSLLLRRVKNILLIEQQKRDLQISQSTIRDLREQLENQGVK